MEQPRSWAAYRGGRIARIAQLLITRYVDRFHPAALVADFLDEPEILEAFRLINGVPGIAEAVIRWYGPIRATAEGFVKDPDYWGRTPIEIVKPLRTAKPREQRMALRYLVYSSARHWIDPLTIDENAESTLSWGDRTPWVRRFAEEWQAFCGAMLPFYRDMSYLDQDEITYLTEIRGVLLTRPLRDDLGAIDESPAYVVDDRNVAGALLGSLTRNIYYAVLAHAKFTLSVRAGSTDGIIEEAVSIRQQGVDRRFELSRFDDLEHSQITRAKDDLVQLMIRSLYRDPPSRLLAFMIGVKNVMAALITADPTFVLRNSTRDTFSAFVLGRAWMVPVFDTLRGAGAFSLRSEDAKQWFLQGGAFSTLLESAADDSERTEPTFPSLATTYRFRRIAHRCRQAYNFITTPARALEAGTRIMQFRRMLNGGATPRQAALASRGVATDFANRGAGDDPVTFVIRTTVFLNAAIQGLNETRKVALTRSGMGGKTRFWGSKAPKFWGAGILGLTALSGFAWYHSTSTNENLEKYEALTTYHKSAYVHFTGVESFQGHLRIPVPFEVGFLFQKVPEIVFDNVADLDTSDTDPIARGVVPPTAKEILQTSFLLSSLPVPSAVAPVFDHVRNRNFFGAEIVPYYMMRRPVPARHFRSTPSTYIRAGEWLNVSPLVLKHYVETYGGNVARNAMVAAESLTWDENAHGPKAFPSGALRATGMAAFSTAPFRSRSRWADDYYAIAEEVGHQCYMVRRLTGPRLDAFIAENASVLQLCQWKTEADAVLRPFGHTVHEWGFVNPTISRQEKESYITDLYTKRDEFYRRAYRIARDHLLAQD
ncbi:MAG: hypothetical protein OXI90_04580 [Gammaproteobacteria bacterium]|nr:hypothetical protein [Gammaproteobacteria bacterium]